MSQSPLPQLQAKVLHNQLDDDVALHQLDDDVALHQLDDDVALHQLDDDIPLPELDDDVHLPKLGADVLLPKLDADVPLHQLDSEVPLHQLDAEVPLHQLDADVPLNQLYAEVPLPHLDEVVLQPAALKMKTARSRAGKNATKMVKQRSNSSTLKDFVSQELLNTDLERYLTHNSRNHASWWTADVSRNDSLTNMTDNILSSTRLTENMTGILSPAKEAEMTSIFSSSMNEEHGLTDCSSPKVLAKNKRARVQKTGECLLTLERSSSYGDDTFPSPSPNKKTKYLDYDAGISSSITDTDLSLEVRSALAAAALVPNNEEPGLELDHVIEDSSLLLKDYMPLGSFDASATSVHSSNASSNSDNPELEGTYPDVTYFKDVSLGLCSLDYSFLNTEDASPSENVQETSTSSFEYKSKVDNWREASELDSDDESVDFDADFEVDINDVSVVPDPRIDDVIQGLKKFFLNYAEIDLASNSSNLDTSDTEIVVSSQEIDTAAEKGDGGSEEIKPVTSAESSILSDGSDYLQISSNDPHALDERSSTKETSADPGSVSSTVFDPSAPWINPKMVETNSDVIDLVATEVSQLGFESDNSLNSQSSELESPVDFRENLPKYNSTPFKPLIESGVDMGDLEIASGNIEVCKRLKLHPLKSSTPMLAKNNLSKKFDESIAGSMMGMNWVTCLEEPDIKPPYSFSSCQVQAIEVPEGYGRIFDDTPFGSFMAANFGIDRVVPETFYHSATDDIFGSSNMTEELRSLSDDRTASFVLLDSPAKVESSEPIGHDGSGEAKGLILRNAYISILEDSTENVLQEEVDSTDYAHQEEELLPNNSYKKKLLNNDSSLDQLLLDDSSKHQLLVDDSSRHQFWLDDSSKLNSSFNLLIDDSSRQQLLFGSCSPSKLLLDDSIRQQLLLDDSSRHQLLLDDSSRHQLLLDDSSRHQLLLDDSSRPQLLLDDSCAKKQLFLDTSGEIEYCLVPSDVIEEQQVGEVCEQVGAEASGKETDFTFLDSLYFFAEKVVQMFAAGILFGAILVIGDIIKSI